MLSENKLNGERQLCLQVIFLTFIHLTDDHEIFIEDTYLLLYFYSKFSHL